MVRRRLISDQIRQIEDARLERLKQAPNDGPLAMVRLLAREYGVGVETADILVQKALSRSMRDRRAVARYAGLTGISPVAPIRNDVQVAAAQRSFRRLRHRRQLRSIGADVGDWCATIRWFVVSIGTLRCRRPCLSRVRALPSSGNRDRSAISACRARRAMPFQSRPAVSLLLRASPAFPEAASWSVVPFPTALLLRQSGGRRCRVGSCSAPSSLRSVSGDAGSYLA